MSSKFAPDVPKSLIDAVSSIMNEAKADELPPIDKTEAQKRKERQAKLDAIEDKRAERDAGKEKPKSAVTKVTGHQYGGSKQKDDPEQQDEELKGNQHKIDANKNGKIDADDFKKLRAKKEEVEIEERTMTSAETKEKEHIVKSMKKGLAGFKARYGSKAKNVMYATATKQAMKKEETVTEGIVNHADIAKDLVKKHGKNVTMDHIDDYIDGADDAHKVDKREVLHHIKLLQDMKWEEVEITEGKMKDIFTTMQMHATKKGYKNHKQFTPDDYHQMGKEHGISGQDLSVIAGHKTAAQAEKDLPFTPDKNPKKIATAGKHGYGPSAAAHLAHQGMAGLTKEGTGGPIYSKPIVKLGDLLARAKDMRNIKKATIVTPKSENEVVLKKEDASDYRNNPKADKAFDDHANWAKGAKATAASEATKKAQEATRLARAEDAKDDSDQQYDSHKDAARLHQSAMKHYEKGSDNYKHHEKMANQHKEILGEETEQVDETMMGKAGCTAEDDKKKDKKPVDYDKPTFLRKGGDWRKSNPAYLPKPVKEEVVSEAHFMEIPSHVKKEIKKHIDNGDHDAARSAAVKAGYWSHFNHLVSAAAHSSHMDHDMHHTDIKQLHPYMSDYLTDKKTNESVEQLDEVGDTKAGREKLAKVANRAVGDTTKDKSRLIKKIDKKLYGNPDLRYKSEGFNTFKGVAAEIKAGTFNRSKPDPELTKQKKKDLESSFENKTKKRTEEVSIDETATLDKYIRSMGYDPQHLDKNKKVMFAKTNAYKTFASSQKTEGLYDGGQKGTQDIDTHMSPGATARG